MQNKNMNNVDIIEIDKKIKIQFDGKEVLQFYLLDSIQLMNEYKELILLPKKVNFLGKKETNNETSNRMENLIKDFLQIVKKFNFDFEFEDFDTCNSNFCCNCGSNVKTVESICTFCYSEHKFYNEKSFTDIERVNISTRFSYDRKSHFRECINQYSGRQNVTIPNEVFKEIEKSLEFNGLLSSGTNREEKYLKVTKNIILHILKDLGFSKHYENLNLIFNTLTGTKLDDISYLQKKLLSDFDDISEMYDKIYSKSNRKNFVNTSYLLYLLLIKNGHSCNRSDFTNLKNHERKAQHDEILKCLFEHLGWNYTSLY
jgi:hypothetical protein